MTIFYPFPAELLTIFFPPELSFTFFDLVTSQTGLNKTTSGRKRKKETKWGKNEIRHFDRRRDSCWTMSNKLSAQQTSCENCAPSAGRRIPFSWGHDLDDLSAVETVVRFLEKSHKSPSIMTARSDLSISCQHLCTRGRLSVYQRLNSSLRLGFH